MPSDDTGLFGSASRTETADLLSSLQWYCEGNFPNLLHDRPSGPVLSPRLEGSASSSFDEAPLLPLGPGEVGPLVALPLSGASASSTDVVSHSEAVPRRGLRNAVVVVALLYPAG